MVSSKWNRRGKTQPPPPVCKDSRIAPIKGPPGDYCTHHGTAPNMPTAIVAATYYDGATPRHVGNIKLPSRTGTLPTFAGWYTEGGARQWELTLILDCATRTLQANLSTGPTGTGTDNTWTVTVPYLPTYPSGMLNLTLHPALPTPPGPANITWTK